MAVYKKKQAIRGGKKVTTKKKVSGTKDPQRVRGGKKAAQKAKGKKAATLTKRRKSMAKRKSMGL